MERVYRFRSTDRLLGSSQELQRQEIYFASPSELNDPTEGIFPFVWQGDKIIWTNFFRHYLYCLHCKCLDFALMADHKKIADIPLPIMGGSLPPTTVMSQIHGTVIQKVFKDTNVEESLNVLAQSEYPVGNNEILFLFQIFHWKAIEVIRAVHQEFGYPLPYFRNEPCPFNPINGFLGILESMMRENSASTPFLQIAQSFFEDRFLVGKYTLEQQEIDNSKASDIQ